MKCHWEFQKNGKDMMGTLFWGYERSHDGRLMMAGGHVGFYVGDTMRGYDVNYTEGGGVAIGGFDRGI